MLRQLEIDIPSIVQTEGVNGFLRAFEDRSELILGLAEGSEQEYVLDCLFIMLRKSGVRDGFNGFTLH
ncbi:hypothetical protein HDE76_001861 [Rhodanobacter sp. ANJX3]|uniref:hypothetical protein n=1 Tax=Rhodanobacter sp. ANJX3 TaxID=2723083 RepID=UPI00161F9697|nr:hypothetical protein [Rhodanobacter sp. ANJX3]MBB5358645.1 hypothetical protein [Rhodanobacter sp. ANJX3]